MSDTRKLFDEAIEKLLTERTFSLEIVEKVKTLRDRLEAAEARNTELTKKLDTLQQNYDLRGKELKSANDELILARKRDVELAAREKEADKLKFERDQHVERRQEMLDILGVVFKSPVYRAHTYGSRQEAAPSSNYMQTLTNSQSTDQSID